MKEAAANRMQGLVHRNHGKMDLSRGQHCPYFKQLGMMASRINIDIRKTNLLGISYPESYVVKCNERANLGLKSIKMHYFRNKNGKSLLKVLDMHVWW